MTAATLTGPQKRYLLAIVEAGTKTYNGRARKPGEALEAAGLVSYEYDLIPHVIGRWTERYVVAPTERGRAVAAEIDRGAA